jgi:hypothetical protein
MRKIGDFLESLVVVVILLALVHTFLEDFAVLVGWTIAARRWIIWAGLGIDLLFTLEFFTRVYIALSRGELGRYFFRDRGWVDLLASIPLLLFNSLPNTLSLLAGAGLATGLGSFLNVLKVIKAVRIARILRLLRVTRIFRRIRYVRSTMAQRHLSTITTISVTILVFWLLSVSVLSQLGFFRGIDATFLDRQASFARHVTEVGPERGALGRRAVAAAALEPTLLIVRQQGGIIVWSRFDDAYYAHRLLPGDYGYFAANGVEVFLDERPYAQAQARENIIYFAAIVLIVLAYLFLYSPLFALWITDPIHVMKRGMSERDYNLEVKVPTGHAEEDVFQLARYYNSVFLPLKDREGATETEQEPSLKMDDIRDILDRG